VSQVPQESKEAFKGHLPDANVGRGINLRSRAGDSFATLYSFQGGVDGDAPVGDLLNVNGTLYGTSSAESEACGHTCGTVFAITTSGHKSTLHTFTGNDGAIPYGSLIQVNGTLYGTTYQGGTNGCGSGTIGCGTIYKISPSGQFSVLYDFKGGSDGAYPFGGLVYLNGTFYGTTSEGGTVNRGTVFSLSSSGQEAVLHSFGLGLDGYDPQCTLIPVNGVLYGTTALGGGRGMKTGGTIFSITTSGAERVIDSFEVNTKKRGYTPLASLTYAEGNIYGTTSAGGETNHGTVFSIAFTGKKPKKAVTIYNFAGPPDDGQYPSATLSYANGTIYGTTNSGGEGMLYGTIFSLTPSGTETVLYNFSQNSSNPQSPSGGVTWLNSVLYGVTQYGGSYDLGTVYALSLRS
jgi:uncharacterized repeat protein (TIGR03803 family)